MTHARGLHRTVVLATLLIAPPAVAADFPTVVRSILDHQTDGPLAEMDTN